MVNQVARLMVSFNTQPPEGGWRVYEKGKQLGDVSTHSRLKAAGYGGGVGFARF